jgi:multidrug efflux pump subunit AcrA (membrane-fusion protein)
MMKQWLMKANRRQKALGAVAAVALCVAGVYALAHSSKKAPMLPTFQVKRGEFLDVIQFRGELKAMKSQTIIAPANAGDLQILTITPDGAQVKEGDVVVQFDPSQTQQSLAQNQSTLKSSQAEIDQIRAQGRLTVEQDTTAVVKARYDLAVAKLDASKSEVVSKIEGEEANLKVADAEQALRQAETQLKSDQSIDLSAIDSKKQASKKASYDAERARQSLAAMTLKAPASGTISLLNIWHNGNESPFKAGERAWSGTAIAELPDAASLRVTARVDETERGRLAVSQPVTVQLDAIADRQFTGKVERIGTIASADFSAGWPFPRNFDIEIVLDQSDPRLKPGMTVQSTVIVDRIADAITIPAQASFVKSGQTVVYLWNGSAFEERAIQIERRSRDRILVASGLRAGELVSLKDPTVKE